jgi:hypothetical protein
MTRRQEHPEKESRTEQSAGPEEPQVSRPRVPILVDITTVLSGVISAILLYREAGWRWAVPAVLATVVLLYLERTWDSSYSRLRRLFSKRVLWIRLALFAIICLSIVVIARDNPPTDKAPEAPQKSSLSDQTLVLVADFEAPDSRTAKRYRLAEAFRRYPDVRVAPLGRTITEHEGSKVARNEGERQRASVVIWGWYGVTRRSAIVSPHFEVLTSPSPFDVPFDEMSTKGSLRKYSISDLERFDVQDDLSSELLYSSELTVGIVRMSRSDWNGALSHLNGAVTASKQRSRREKALAHFYRGAAHLMRAGTRDFSRDERSKKDLHYSAADSGAAIRLENRFDMPA